MSNVSLGGFTSSLMSAYSQIAQAPNPQAETKGIPEQKGIPAAQPQSKEGTQEMDERCLGMVVQHY